MRVTHKRGGWLALMLAGGLLLAGTALPAAPAAAEDSAPGEAAAEAPPPVELIVAPHEPVIDHRDADTDFRVLVRNTGKETLPEGSIELSIGDVLTEASTVDVPSLGEESTGPDTAIVPPIVIANETVGATAGGADQVITVTVPTERLPFASVAARGVYPLHASYVASDATPEQQLSAYSPIVWNGLEASPEAVNLTLIIPFLLPSDIHTMPTRSQLGDLAPGFDALLDYATSVRAVLAIDPRIIAGIRAYGDEAPQNARELLTRLEQSDLTSFLLQFSDADPAAQAALGATELLAPQSLDFVTRHGSWPEPDPTDESSEDAGADAGDEVAESDTTGDSADGSDVGTADPDNTGTDNVAGPPTLEQLGMWDQGLPAAWPAAGQTGLGTIALLRSEGLSTTVLRSDNVTFTGGPRATLGIGEAIVTDAELGAGVQLALRGSTEVERELGEARATARLILAADTGSPGLVLGVDRGSFSSADSARELLESLTSQPWVNAVDFAAQESGEAQLVPRSPEEERVDLLGTAQQNEEVVLEIRTLLVNPEYLDGYQRMRLLSLFATSNASPDVRFDAVAKRFAKRDAELHDGISIVGTKHAQLVGTSTRIPIQVRNTLPFDAITSLTVAPTSAVLSVPQRTFTDILIPQDSTERVLIPVQSRVSSGESALRITLTDVSGDYKAASDILPISVSTNVETIALATLGVAAVLLFGFGIWRSLRRRRTPQPRD